MPALITILEIAAPALFGVVSAVIVGHRQVRRLREITGDDSTLTGVLSGEAFRRHEQERKAA